jgi:hypothetical protein
LPLPENLTPALADSVNPPLSHEEQQNFNNDCFINDNSICAVHLNILPVIIQQSLLTAFVLFDWSSSDRWGSCITPNKWDPTISFSVLFLSYQISI